MIRQLANEFVKNLKIMFRNWTSLSLLVIAPLVLILLIGYTFSSEEVSGIKIGVVSKESINLEPLRHNVSNYADLEQFDCIEECLSEMALQKVHICISLEGELLAEQNLSSVQNIPSGKVIYYYDNSRKKVSLALVQNIQGFFGLKAEQISIEGAEAIIENIQRLIEFINQRKEDVYQIKNESLIIRADLIERKAKLEKTRADFLPTYNVIKQLQADMHNYSSEVYNTTGQLSETSNKLILTLQRFKDSNGAINLDYLGTQSYLNKTIDAAGLESSLKDLDSNLMILSNLLNSTTSDINSTVSAVDDMVEKLDNIKILLDEEIVRTDNYIVRIDQSIVKINAVISELDTKLELLTTLQPGMAEKLVKPIMYEYELLLRGLKNIQASFPSLLVIIIMFIALLFSNISTLMELNDRAHLRNLIAPVNNLIYMLGMLFTTIIIVFLQIIVLFIVSQTKLDIMITPVFWQISLISILLIIFFVLVGMLFAYSFNSVQSSILITTFSALIFFLFSNALAPIEAMPSFARLISTYNPLVIGEYIIKQIQLFNTPLSYLIPKIALLATYVFLLFFVVVIVSKEKNKKRI